MAEPAGTGLSVFVIARDEEARLGRTLAAVAGLADQLVVVDSGSTDRTVEIARAAGAEVHVRAWEGYGPQKAFAESLCRHDWLLNLDADEVVSDALAAEIRALLDGRPAPGAWRLRILTVYPGDARPRPLASDYSVVRLYHRDAGRYRAHPLFDRVDLAPGIVPGRLRAPVLHHPVLSWAQFVEKENRYTSFQAEAARPRARALLLVRLPFEMPVAFLKFYLLRGHVTGGWKGFAFALIAAFGRALRIVKLLEREKR